MKRIISLATFFGIFLTLFAVAFGQRATIKKQEGELWEKAKKLSENLPPKDSNRFRVPTEGQLKAWRFIAENVLKNNLDDAQKLIKQLDFPYELTLFTDKTAKREYVLLEENYPIQGGWGFYVFDLKTSNPLVLQIPHPVSDGNTEFQGVDAFLQTRAKALFIAGTHRRSNAQETNCTQPKSAREDMTYPVSDVAHSVRTPFQVVHETIVKSIPTTVTVQLHGMVGREACPNAFMSNGTKSVTTNSKKLLSCLQSKGVESEIFDGSNSCQLNALSNTQGRFSNGETENPCQKNAKSSPEPGAFIHIEQEPNLRKNRESWAPVVEALKCAFPAEDKKADEPPSFVLQSAGVPDVKVFYAEPIKINDKTKVLFVMAGRSRNADEYLASWTEWAKRNNYFVLAPYFDDKNWVEPLGYNFGNIASGKERDNVVNPREKWAFHLIETMFDQAKSRFGLKAKKYDIFGHSAGGQFVHRFMLFYPENRVRSAIAANPGFYTLPDLEAEFPYGLKNSPVAINQKELLNWTKKDLILMRGTADVQRTENLRQTPEADAQGRNRFERALFMFNKIKALNPKTKWRLIEVPDVAHDQKGMALAAQKVLEAENR